MRSTPLLLALLLAGCPGSDDDSMQSPQSDSGSGGETPESDDTTSDDSESSEPDGTTGTTGEDSGNEGHDDESSTTGEPIDACGPAIDLVPLVELMSVFPDETDPQMRAEELPHLYAEPLGEPRDQLLVFFPGTDPGFAQGMQTPGGPEAYTDFLRQAAGVGYHTIGLMYVNDIPVNAICPGNPPTADCHERLREEIITGVDLHESADVPPVDSIIHRLETLIAYAGWDQYLEDDGSVAWDRVAVAGHSQGGGHAAFLGRMFEVDRVIMTASTEQARWTRREQFPLVTPADRFYGFSSELDVVYSNNIAGWSNLQVPGSLTAVDDGLAPANGSHQLTISVDAEDDNHHGTAVNDISTPRTEMGTPMFRDVWCYLLTDE